MAENSLPPEVDERKIREDWIDSLGAASDLRLRQGYESQLLTAPEIRSAAQRIGPLLVGRYGPESPQVYRAVAALVTASHPTVLALMLSGLRTADESL